jgi:serine/threonine-protein kinase
MALSAGTKIGPYEILGLLGAGGMGEVYRARDSRLNRDVAIKTLSDAFAADAERLARFQREAQVLAALNHPNIAAIYGVEESALVMELVEGHDLSGPLAVDEAIAVARQIADALDAAHQKNIVHRDLKPGNIKRTPEGQVKVLDFGLAKALDHSAASADAMSSATITMDSTRAGMIMGTPGYMSPEQARGSAVDKRADIWSFGVVFYEMLAGVRTFGGDTASDALAAVLRADIDWAKLPATTPPGVRKLLERCLERDPNKRLRDIGDAWAYFETVPMVEAVPRVAKSSWIPWGAAAAAMIALGASWLWLRGSTAEGLRTVTRAAMNLPSFASSPVLTRDGARLAYIDFAPKPHLMIRMMNELEGKPVPGGDAAFHPVFSPDGQSLAYVWVPTSPGASKLLRIPVGGGTPITVCDLPSTQVDPSWGVDDSIVFGTKAGLMKVAAAGGVPQALTTANAKDGETGHFTPEVLAGGQTVLFTVSTGASGRIGVLDIKSGKYHTLANVGVRPRYSPTGHLLYARGGALFAAPFDLKQMVTTGPEIPVVEGLFFSAYTFSDSSVMVFQEGGHVDAPSTLEWTDRTGAGKALTEPAHYWGGFELSPDGKMMAGAIQEKESGDSGHFDVWVYDVERRTLTRLTLEGSNNSPVWTPDGKWVTYDSIRGGRYGIYRSRADRSGQPELLLSSDSAASPRSWTPDGKTLFYVQSAEGKRHIWVLPDDGKRRQFTASAFNEDYPQVSPDGKWVAYDSDESSRPEVYVVPASGTGGKFQISAQGGREQKWSRNGRELYYKDQAGQLMAVEITSGAAFRAGQPHALFKLSAGGWFAVTPDPKRFLVERMPEAGGNTTFITITNWFDDLRRRAPGK